MGKEGFMKNYFAFIAIVFSFFLFTNKEGKAKVIALGSCPSVEELSQENIFVNTLIFSAHDKLPLNALFNGLTFKSAQITTAEKKVPRQTVTCMYEGYGKHFAWTANPNDGYEKCYFNNKENNKGKTDCGPQDGPEFKDATKCAISCEEENSDNPVL